MLLWGIIQEKGWQEEILEGRRGSDFIGLYTGVNKARDTARDEQYAD